MTNEELIEKINETANILSGAMKLTDGAEVSLRAPWLRGLSALQMLALIEHFNGTLFESAGEAWATASVAGVSVYFYGPRLWSHTNDLTQRLRAAAATEAITA